MAQGPGTPSVGGPPPGYPAGPPASTAGLGVRIGARLLDVLIVWIPAMIVFGIVGLGTSLLFGTRGWITSTILSLLWFGYFVWFESTTGATLGKKLLNLRVVVADGSSPSLEVATKRNLWMLFGLIPWVGGALWFIAVIVIIVTISSNPDHRGYHDTFAGTAVMR